MKTIYKNMLFTLLLITSSYSLHGMIESAFPDEVIQLTAEQEEQLQEAIAFVEQQMLEIIINYMLQNQSQYAFCGGIVYEIRGEELYIYSIEELDEQKAMWVLQFDITDYVLDHLSNDIDPIVV